MEYAFDKPFFVGQGMWHKFGNEQLDQLVNHMKGIHKKKQNGELKLNIDGINCAKKFGWENCVKNILKELE